MVSCLLVAVCLGEEDWTVAQWKPAPESKSLIRANQVRLGIKTMGVFPALRRDYEAAFAEWRAKPSG